MAQCQCLPLQKGLPGTLCYVLGQDNLLSQCLSLHIHVGVHMGTREFITWGNPWGNPVMD